ncbi:MAG: ABC transporter permease [Planctomycetes bacterium]|nr:ABC transporter permease [Planctomycetota bacterium]
MYRSVLCLRYLMRRWLTLLAMVAVFLGVGALVVVTAVTSGMATQVRQAIRGGLSDVIIEYEISGFRCYDEFTEAIRRHPNVRAATPVIFTYGLVNITPNARGYEHARVPKQGLVYGVRPEELAQVSRFTEFLVTRQSNVERPSFDVPEDVARQMKLLGEKVYPGCIPGKQMVTYDPPPDSPMFGTESVLLSSVGATLEVTTFPIKEGGTFRTMPGSVPRINTRRFTVVDHYKSRLYDFDRQNIYIPFDVAQEMTGLAAVLDEDNKVISPGRAHQILVRLRDYSKAKETIADLGRMWPEVWFEQNRLGTDSLFRIPPPQLSFQTWEERQATIIGAYEMQRTGMLLLLGMIVLVAGFLIGAMLSMIVKEKTRDIGILKSLGASNLGVAQIFVLYALTISAVASLLGLVAGLYFTWNIDPIERQVSAWLGTEIVARQAYYFDRIPTDVDPLYTTLIVVAAVAIAVASSLFAAYRAARLQPVEALRYE